MKLAALSALGKQKGAKTSDCSSQIENRVFSGSCGKSNSIRFSWDTLHTGMRAVNKH